MDTGKHPMQALLLSSRRFTHRFYRESAIDISGQVHRCGFSAEGKHFSTKVHLICIGCTWIIAIAVHAPYFYTFRLLPYGNESYQCRLSWEPAFNHTETHKRYVTATFITFVLVPICILAVVYGTIAWTLRQKARRCKRNRVIINRDSANKEGKLYAVQLLLQLHSVCV